MILPVDLFEFVDVVVGVYLCGSEAAVAQKVFYGLNVGPVIEQVRGKGVPQHMGAFLFQGGALAQVFCYYPVDVSCI